MAKVFEMREVIGKPVVIDNGSYSIKAGFAGDDEPIVKFRNVLATPKVGSDTLKDLYIGDEVEEILNIVEDRDSLRVKCPISRGIITNWDDMETIWEHTFNELNVTPEEHPVFLTEPSLNPRNNREKMTQIMFETFNVPSMYGGNQAVYSLYASGSNTGVVIDCGYEVTNIVSIVDTYFLSFATTKGYYGGKNIDEYLCKLINERGYSLDFEEHKEAIRNIKEKLAFVALDFEQELDTNVDKTYNLPDGRVISLGNELFRCSEALFKPNLIESESYGVHKNIYSTIMKCEVDIRREMFSHILLTGGSTFLPGFKDRVFKELKILFPLAKIEDKNILSLQNKDILAWKGGSIFSSQTYLNDSFISKEEYDENGPAIIHRKCF
eukprot:TRINITY_DN858_c0_g1_i1.p1 TRINITY_DN858_c0_g1~~TRINITY_DN858_c0_g1_i1.p1  ORF type:complete len:381 (+),score=113.49 TRINITY_DN858_c0_g1_i1:119-1261(+)